MGSLHRRILALVVCTSACATAVEDGVFSSASGGASVGGSATKGDDPLDESSGRAEEDTGDDGVSGQIGDSSDDGAVDESTSEDDGAATINPLDDGGSTGELDGGGTTGPVDPTIDPTDDPTLDPTDDGGAAGDCCTAHGGLGCDDPGVEACVCGLDDVCCGAGWDEICVQEAAQCGAGCMGGGGADCCVPQAGTGCSDAAIEACVCGFDAFCCDTQWDDVCAFEASDCGAPC